MRPRWFAVLARACIAADTRRTMRDARGFTLIELLVVMTILGILAAIAFASLSGQRDRAADADAKSRAGNLVRAVEACGVDADDFRECAGPTTIEPLGLKAGPGPGQVEVRDAARRTYVVVAHSVTGAEFRVERRANGTFRSCTPPGRGGCHSGALW